MLERRGSRRVPRRRAARRRVDRPDAQAARHDLGGCRASRSRWRLLPLLWWLGALQMWHLYAVALVVGIATVFFDVSYQSIIPSLVRPSQIAEANGKLQSTYELANIAGPGIGGWLVGALTAPLAILATVGTYLDLVRRAAVHPRPRAAARPRGSRADPRTRSGRVCASSSPRSCCAGSSARPGSSNFFNTISMTMLPIFILRELGLSPASMGVIFSLGAVGGLLGAIATPHIVRRIGEARAIPISSIGFSVVGRLPAPRGDGPRGRVPAAGRAGLRRELHRAALQHHAGHVPSAHHAATPARPDERVRAVRGVGRDADRRAALGRRSAPGSAWCRRCGSARSASSSRRCSSSSGRSGRCAICPMSESADVPLTAAAARTTRAPDRTIPSHERRFAAYREA